MPVALCPMRASGSHPLRLALYALRSKDCTMLFAPCPLRHALCDLLLGGPTFLGMTPVNSVDATPKLRF